MLNAYSAFPARFRRLRVQLSLMLALLPVSAFACTPMNPDAQPPYVSAQSADKRFELRISNALPSHPDTRPSGMYKTDDLDHPLWKLDGTDNAWHFAYIFVSSDGVHVARLQPNTYSSESEALAIFEQGRLVRSYRLRELVTTTHGLHEYFLPCGSLPSFGWLGKVVMDDAKGELRVSTATGEEHEIDIVTGRIEHSSRNADYQPDADTVIQFEPGGRTIRLNHPEPISGTALPAGTEVSLSWTVYGVYPGVPMLLSRPKILRALLHQPVGWKGRILMPGTALALRNRHLIEEKNPERIREWEESPDEYADMVIVSVSPPRD